MGFDKMLSLHGRQAGRCSRDRPFQQCDIVDEVILVVSSDRRTEFQQVVNSFRLTKVNRLGGRRI